MSQIHIAPAPLNGMLTVPPSKSIYHRALILAALSEKGGRIRPLFDSDDIAATAGILSKLGARIEKKPGQNAYLVYPLARPAALSFAPGAEIAGGAVSSSAGIPVMDCGESGSTVRFLLPVAAALGRTCAFTGRGRLPKRPLTPYFDLFPAHGVQIRRGGEEELPLTLCGRLRSGAFTLPGDISSQYITGLLFACALMPGESRLHLSSPLQSAPYVAITREMLDDFGVVSERLENGDFVLSGGQQIRSRDYTVESDWSQAAFFFMAGVLGSTLSLAGLRPDSRQGDKRIAEIAASFGAKVDFSHGVYHIAPPPGPIRPVHIADASDIPDIIPVIAAAAAFADGVSVIENCGRLRIKESDRLAATIANIRAIGGRAHSEGDTLIIAGQPALPGGRVDAFGDHRMVMAFAVAATRCEKGILIDGSEAVRKSYPTFFADFTTLGGRVNELHD